MNSRDCPYEICSPNSEIAVIRTMDEEFVTDVVCAALDIECWSSVIGYVSPSDFARICDYVSKMEEVKE